MIDAFTQLRHRLINAFETIQELRIALRKQQDEQQTRERELALTIIRQMDQCEQKNAPESELNFLKGILEQLHVSRIPSPVDQSPEYALVVERVPDSGQSTGTVLRLEGGAYVQGEQLIRPALLVVAE